MASADPVVSANHVHRLLTAFGHGHTESAEAHARGLERLALPSPAQAGLQESLVLLAAARAATMASLDVIEQHGHGGVAHLCLRIVREPLCTFMRLQRWGVCAWTGRAVNHMLVVALFSAEVTVNDKFARFVLGLWAV